MIKRVFIGNVLASMVWTVVWATAMHSKRLADWLNPAYRLIAEKVVEQIAQQ